jgi:hypothetical protein
MLCRQATWGGALLVAQPDTGNGPSMAGSATPSPARPRLCPHCAFSHVVAYIRQTSALRCTADSLIDSASYSTRWVLLFPAPVTGNKAGRPADPDPNF